jgi:glycosyltransferase involved in cell wall biosynthesis
LSSSKDIDISPGVMFTVVIGTFNGEPTLSVALDALESQVTEFTYEIVVVNDASTDATEVIANRPNVRLINLEMNQGHGATLNEGLTRARGQFMAMMDDDCVPYPDWIQQLGLVWRSVGPDVTMIGGLVEPFETDTFNRRYVAFRRPLHHQEAEIDENAGFWTRLIYQLSPPKVKLEPHAVFFAVGANMSVRVSAARQVGGFSDIRGAGEEESLARPLRSKYGTNTVQLFPAIVMRHDFQPSFRDTLRRSRHYGRTSGREWMRDRGLPSLSPLFPCAILIAGVIAFVSPLWALIVLVLSPYVLYRGWVTSLKSGRPLEVMLYPYAQASEEVANNVGFVQGVWRDVRRSRQ